MYKIENRKSKSLCSSCFRNGFSQVLPDSVSGDHEIFTLKDVQMKNMVQQNSNAQCCLLKAKTPYKLGCVPNQIMWYFKFLWLQTPLSVTILRTSNNGYWLSICACSCAKPSKKHLDYGPVPFSALSVEQMPVTVMYTLYYQRNCCSVGVQSQIFGLFGVFLQENLLDRWETVQILRIFRLFSQLVIEIVVFVVDCPNYSGYLSER